MPTFVIGPELFWGDDVMDMMIEYLNDPNLFTKGDLGRLGNIPVGIQRKESRYKRNWRRCRLSGVKQTKISAQLRSVTCQKRK